MQRLPLITHAKLCQLLCLFALTLGLPHLIAAEVGSISGTVNNVATGNNLDYINIFDAFLGPDGQPREDLFVADRLHHNAAGYEVRVEITRLHLGTPAKSDAAKGKSGSPRPAGKP